MEKSGSNKRSYPNVKSSASNTKKSKNIEPTQSNSILNYFGSSLIKKIEPIKQETLDAQQQQPHLDESNKENKQQKEDLAVKKENKTNAFDLLLKSKPASQQSSDSITKKPNVLLKDENHDLDDETSSLSKNKPVRTCPFYKRIEGTQISVDAFSYGDINNCNAYFLSHFHYDHYTGLSKHFKHKIYCSKITANLVLKKIKVDSSLVCPLELNNFLKIYDDDDSIEVCLIDANHCPGSVMFLFKFKKTGKYVLHTGDFRASDELCNNKLLQNIKIDTVHMDTTYCDSFYKFLPQSEIIELGVEVVQKELKTRQNKTLVVCGSYTIGKERIFVAIAEAFNAKVYVEKEKMNIIECLEDPRLKQLATLNSNETFIHVIPMGKLNIRDLEEYISKYPAYENLIAIKPTGWTHKDNSALNMKKGVSVEKTSRIVKIYGLEYSEHSSFEELKNFVKTIRPRKIIPHVNVASKESRDKMSNYFQEWLKKA